MKARRGFTTLLAAVPLLLGAITFTTTATASAAGGCGWSFTHFPKQYAIGSKPIDAFQEGSCTWNDNWWLDVTLRDASGNKVPGSYNEVTGCGGDWYYYDPYTGDDCLDTSGYSYTEVDDAIWTITAPGTYTTHDVTSLSYDCCNDYYTDHFNPQTTVAKYATGMSLRTTRSGNKVLFVATPSHYSPASHGYINSPNAKVIIQKLDRFGRWQTMDTYTGPTSKVYKLYNKQTVRALLPETRTTWGRNSLKRTV